MKKPLDHTPEGVLIVDVVKWFGQRTSQNPTTYHVTGTIMDLRSLWGLSPVSLAIRPLEDDIRVRAEVVAPSHPLYPFCFKA